MSYATETKESLWEHLKVVEDERNALLKNLIEIEEIDRMAEDLKNILCNESEPEERERFELEIYNYLKEALDPWRSKQ